MQPTSSDLITKTDEILQSEGIKLNVRETGDKLQVQILPAMAATRDIQAAFYSFEPASGQTTIRVLKDKFLRKVKNMVINIMDRTITRQQQYNELTFQAISELKAQIDELKRGK